mmetsp:Transcript_5395/g.7803  ORF Transcript_5395/g.7803 Transcript_5395/m.7803 type:complete len:111 (-) Transcript_5395:2099-2431(-)
MMVCNSSTSCTNLNLSSCSIIHQSETMLRPTPLLRQAERLVNRNPLLYGPGPVARRPQGGIGAMPPLRGLVVCASQGIAVGLAGGLVYNVVWGNPGIQKVEDYYKENPPR